MELRDYLRILRRRWMLIVVVTALAALAASVYVLMSPKKYAASSTLFVSTPASDSASTNAFQGAQYSQLRVQSYVDMVNGRQLAQQVIDQLHLKMTSGQLSSEITATNKTNTVLLNITVTDRDPNLALRINQAVVTQLTQTIKQIETPPGAKLPLIKVTAVDPAQFSATPVSPKRTTDIGLGVLVGLLLGFGLAVAREILDTSVKDLREVHGFSDVPVIAALPLDSSVSSTPLISGLDRQSPRTEAFRVLRTNLQFLGVDSSSKIYVVSSSVPGEGKSTTATNLAIALAQGGKRVLLVDGDLRRPRVATLLGLIPSVGLTTALMGTVSVSDCLQVHAESGLSVLTAGAVPPNPAELLQSQAMIDVLAALREDFDVILIDAPPLLPVTDAALLGNLADGVLLMVRHSKTTKDQLQGAVHRIEGVDASLAGVIFNMVPRRAGAGDSGYAYGYGYGYASETTQQQKASRRARRRASRAEAQAVAVAPEIESAHSIFPFDEPDEDAAAESAAEEGRRPHKTGSRARRRASRAAAEAVQETQEMTPAEPEERAGVEGVSLNGHDAYVGHQAHDDHPQTDASPDEVARTSRVDAEEIAERERQAAALAERERETAEYLEREQEARQRLALAASAAEPEPNADLSEEGGFVPGRRVARRADGPLGRRRSRPTRS